MSLGQFFRIGETIALGSHLFTADEIKAFARKYDPQPFHVDEKLAEGSVFGALCASGWHTCAMWMRYNLEQREDRINQPWSGPGPRPEFGPSPGFSNLRWLKPVYAGETVSFSRKALALRPLASQPGWQLLTMLCEAADSAGDMVLSFEGAVLVRTG